MKNRLSCLFCLFVCVACANRSGSEEATGNSFSLKGEHITVAEQSPVLKHIKIQPVERGDYRPSFSASGIVIAIPSQYAGIASPFAGRVVKAWVCPGQRVAAGSPIFAVSSPDFTEACKVYFQAKAEMELARKNLRRERDLLANRVGMAKAVEEAEADCEIKQTEYERALAAMRVYQMDPDSLTLGHPLIIRSPLAGEVVKCEIVVGQYIREDADALVVVADLDRVWVKARVKEKDLPLLDRVADVRISLPALPDTLIAGSIRYVGNMLDEETRSVEVMVECGNRNRRMKPFMYGAVQFTGAPAPAVMAPEAAVLQGEDSRYVIVSEGENRFRKVNVTAAPDAENRRTVILSGLREGEAIVTEGAFYFIEAR
jgi:cobalt-zinc-cadmium efflux system membrane fusion protein